MPHLLTVTDSGQQRKNALDHHPHIPRATLTDFHILGVACFAMKTAVGADDHLSCKYFEQRLEVRVREIRRRRLPADDQAPSIQHHAEFATNDPARIRLAFLADALALGKAQLSDWMTEFDAKRVGHAQDGGRSQKAGSPSAMRLESSPQAGALRQIGKQGQVIAFPPTIKISGGGAFKGKEQGQSDHFTRIEFGLWMFLNVLHLVIYMAKEFYDKVCCRQGAVSPCQWFGNRQDRNNSMTFSTSTTC